MYRHPKREARMGSLTDCRRCFASGNDVGLALPRKTFLPNIFAELGDFIIGLRINVSKAYDAVYFCLDPRQAGKYRGIFR